MVNSAYLQYNTSCFHPQIPPVDTGGNSQTYATCPQASSLSPFSRSVYVSSRGLALWKLASFSKEGLLRVLLLVCTQQRVLPGKLQKQTTAELKRGQIQQLHGSPARQCLRKHILRPIRCSQEGLFSCRRVLVECPCGPRVQETPTWVRLFLKQG